MIGGGRLAVRGVAGGERQALTLLMATSLTFGSISALYGLTHQLIDQSQYSVLLMHSTDFGEFYAAWREGRNPAWSGR